MLKKSRGVHRKLRKWLWIGMVALPILLTVLLPAQMALASNTYRIQDGDLVVLHTTFATDPLDILLEAGLPVGEEDIITTQSGPGMAQITLRRKQTVTVIRQGRKAELTTYGETVSQLLESAGICLEPTEVPSVSLDSPTRDQMVITLQRMLRMEETFREAIPFRTVYCYDPAMPKGEQRVITPGQEGQCSTTVSVLYIDGKEQERTMLRQTVLQQPVDQVVAVGTYVEREVPGFMPPDPGKNTTGRPIIGDSAIVTPDGQVLTFRRAEIFCATAYHNTDPGCDAYTATGTIARVGAIAVDPRVIPYGTRMYIVSNDGVYIYGIATAEDCGGSIKGNRIDLYFDTVAECLQFGIRDCTVYFLD